VRVPATGGAPGRLRAHGVDRHVGVEAPRLRGVGQDARRAERRRSLAPGLDRLHGQHLRAALGGEMDAQQADRPAAHHQHAAPRAHVRGREGGNADRQRLGKCGERVAHLLRHLEERIARHRNAIGEHPRTVQPQ